MENKQWTAEEANKAAIAEIVKRHNLESQDNAEITVEDSALRHNTENMSSYWMAYTVQEPHPFKKGETVGVPRIIRGSLSRFREIGGLWSHWKLG